MLGGSNKNRIKPQNGNLRAGKKMPRLSLSLHTMPQTSNSHMKKWLLWGALILLFLVITAYFLFN